jgi:hypothetical protein
MSTKYAFIHSDSTHEMNGTWDQFRSLLLVMTRMRLCPDSLTRGKAYFLSEISRKANRYEAIYNNKQQNILTLFKWPAKKRAPAYTETLCGGCGSTRDRTADPLLVRQML